MPAAPHRAYCKCEEGNTCDDEKEKQKEERGYQQRRAQHEREQTADKGLR